MQEEVEELAQEEMMAATGSALPSVQSQGKSSISGSSLASQLETQVRCAHDYSLVQADYSLLQAGKRALPSCVECLVVRAAVCRLIDLPCCSCAGQD
jgi:hypothetical protein